MVCRSELPFQKSQASWKGISQKIMQTVLAKHLAQPALAAFAVERGLVVESDGGCRRSQQPRRQPIWVSASVCV